MNSSPTWLYFAGAFVELLCVIGVFLYVATRRSDGSRARLFALIGFGLILFQVLGLTLIRFALTRIAGPAAFGESVLLVGVLGNLLSVTSKLFLAAAVFTGRKMNNTDSIVQPLPNSLTADPSNPYQPPGR